MVGLVNGFSRLSDSVAGELARAGLRSAPETCTAVPFSYTVVSVLRLLRSRAGASALATRAVCSVCARFGDLEFRVERHLQVRIHAADL